MLQYEWVPLFDASKVLKLNDTLPPGLNVADTAFGGTGRPHVISGIA
jgi:hypothetical protein